jgi:hypothetical protein
MLWPKSEHKTLFVNTINYQSSPIKQFTLKEEKYFDLIFVFRCFNSKMVSTDIYNRVVDKIGSWRALPWSNIRLCYYVGKTNRRLGFFRSISHWNVRSCSHSSQMTDKAFSRGQKLQNLFLVQKEGDGYKSKTSMLRINPLSFSFFFLILSYFHPFGLRLGIMLNY